MLTDACGDKVRVGKAGVKRALKKPVRLTDDSNKTFAAVLDEDTTTYISTDGDGFNVTWWDEDEEQSADFTKIDEAVEFFLEARKCTSS